MNTDIVYSVPASRLYIITLAELPPPVREATRPGPDCPSLTIDHAAELPQLASYEELQAGMDSKLSTIEAAAEYFAFATSKASEIPMHAIQKRFI
jgi:hypothetical protein